MQKEERVTEKQKEEGEIANTLLYIRTEMSKNTDLVRSVAEGQEKSRQSEKNNMLLKVFPPTPLFSSM